MRRLLTVTLLLAAACSDSVPPTSAPRTSAPVTRDLLAGCTAFTFSELQTLINQVFGASSPDASSALGKLATVQHQLGLGNVDGAQNHAFDLADFIVLKYQQGSIPVAEEDVVELVNGILCFAGLGPFYSDIDNSWILYPNDGPRILISEDGWAGLSLPAKVVSEPTVVSIERLADLPSPLVTDLDKYPLNYDFLKESETNAPFLQNVTVGICPASGVDPTVRARLKLGHMDGVQGFEVLPAANADFLDCSAAPTLPNVSAGGPDLQGLVLADSGVTFAAAPPGGAPGVGGLADSFSPLGPIDPKVSGTSGIGGTADSFRVSALLLSPTCSAIEAPVGTPVDAACRPTVTFKTALGVALDGIPVTYTVETGGGLIAPETPLGCGTFASAVTVLSSSTGEARVCWTLGVTAGAQTVKAVAGYGGDAVPETFFSYAGAGGVEDPAATLIRFSATANPPTALDFSVQPAAGANIAAGAAIPLTARVVDKNGVPVAIFTGPVSITLNKNAFAPGAVTTVNAVAGIATFSGLAIRTAATGYAITAQATLGAQVVGVNGNTFNVVAANATVMTKLAGDGQVVTSGTLAPINPSVRVADTYGNPVVGVTVKFEAQNNTAGVTGGTQVTDANGVATVGSWTVLDGLNNLIAYLQANPLVFVTFSATGSSTLGVMNSCPAGGSGDPLVYPFWVPGANQDVTQVELYLSSNGAVNTPKVYTIALDARLNSFANPVIATSIVPVTLTGRTSEALPTAFRFTVPIDSKNSDKIAFTFRLLNNPDGATITYNTGPCGLGNCKPPRGCAATQVSGTTPLPLGTKRRSSVALRILGQ